MVKKLALTSLFFSGSDVKASLSSPCSPPSMSAASWSTSTSTWQWPSCTQARTMSFSRDVVDDGRGAEVSSSSSRQDYRTNVMNPAYCFLDYAEHSCLSTNSSAASGTGSMSTAAPAAATAEVDEVIRGLRSSTSRLFFEPEATSSIVKPPSAAGAAFGGATAMAIDSADPYGDFRRSMEEMVMSRGGASDDWGWLEEMLGWYLRANGKKTHGLIVGAFVDLLVALTSSSSSTFTKQSDEC